MKTNVLWFCVAVGITAGAAMESQGADPELGAAIAQQFGEAHLRNVVLVKAPPSETDPVQWKVYAIDPYRDGQLLRMAAKRTNGKWDVVPAGAGKLLQRVPKQRLDLRRLRIDSKEARGVARRQADLARVTFAKVDYQLAANEKTALPEWGLALQDKTGYEVGFCVISAETGAVISQDWTPKSVATAPPPDSKSKAERAGEEAARKVKRSVRKAWEWTEKAGRTTGGFFRELFR